MTRYQPWKTLVLLLPLTSLYAIQATRHCQHTPYAARRLHSVSPAADSSILPKELLPVPLLPGAFKPGVDAGRWHWVITTCDRHQWGRMMSTALLTGMANDIHPASITVLWCRSLAQQRASGRPLPGLLYNMRYGTKIHVLMVSEALAALPVRMATKLLFTILSVPTVLGKPSLPVLVTEDDIAWAPDAGTRLEQAIAALPDPSLPYCLALYSPGREAGTMSGNEVLQYNEAEDNFAEEPGATLAAITHVGVTSDGRGGDGGSAGTTTLLNMKHWVPWLRWQLGIWKGPLPHQRNFQKYWYGAQGHIFSASMVARMLPAFLDVLRGNAKESEGLQDHVLDALLDDTWKCTRGDGCYFFAVRPSILQHIGTHSTFFAAENHTGNLRFHVAEDFPIRLRLPGFESNELWKRRHKMRAL